jgi:hypothetical protein
MATLPWSAIGRGVMGFPFNVEIIRGHEGAARAPHETCLRKPSDAMIGSVSFRMPWIAGAGGYKGLSGIFGGVE